MKFVCEKALLVSAISVASRTVAPKSPMAALEGVHVHAGMKLQLTGYNLETGITVSVPAEIVETGTCILPARLFFDIVRKLPDEEVTVSVDDNYKVSIRCGISSFTITATDAENYPELPDVEYANGVSIPQRALKELISGTIFAVSENQTRPVHTGCRFEVTETDMTVVAVDGYRLALRRFHFEEAAGRVMTFVAPGAALKEVEKILGDTDEEARFTLGSKHLMFQIGEATLVCRLLEGEFLDWRRVLPTENPIKLTANVEQLNASIERVSLIVSERLKSPVRCVFSDNSADFKTVTTIGAAHDVCPVAGDGKNLEIGFNCRYLLDALKAVPAQEVTLELSNGLSPIVLTPTDGSDQFAYMVLPVRLKESM